jgi:hypothetical protein
LGLRALLLLLLMMLLLLLQVLLPRGCQELPRALRSLACEPPLCLQVSISKGKQQ